MKQSRHIDDLRSGFAAPDPASRPMVRWWWFGPSVDRRELDRELTAIAAAGLGGVEISYVYPLAGVTSPLLSEAFCADLRFAAERAAELGLRFDLTLGSGWSFGGPHITPDLAARKLHWERRELLPGSLEVAVVSPWPGDELVAAYVGGGSVQEPPDDLVELSVSDGVVIVPQGQGPRQVLLAYSRLTGQNVKRAAVGAEGPVLDHYRAAATQRHLHEVGERLLAAVPAELVGSVFCDSLEVYGADWTPDLLSEFERRRGYDARPLLYLLVHDGIRTGDFRRDYYRTLTELYEENFVAVCRRWAGEHGLPFRIQGYGAPPASVSSYRFADLFEGEGWGWKEITQTRWASSAAHLYGRDVVSSETWTWVHSPSWRATPLDLKGEAHEHFLAGVNQLIGHGWPYSPADAPGLGWFFYAAGALSDRNPWWPAMPELTTYLHRLSWLLRQGEHVSDVKIYLPAGDIARSLGGSLDLWREAKRHIGDDLPRIVREAGFDFDVIDDDALAVLDPELVPVVLLPDTTVIPSATREWLDRVQQLGGSVLAVGATGPAGVPRVGADELARTLASLIAPDVRLGPASQDVGVVHRRTQGGADLYFLANTGPSVTSFTCVARTSRERVEEWDPQRGSVRRSASASSPVEVTLQPYEATVLVFFDGDAGAVRDGGQTGSPGRRPLTGPWQLQYLDSEQVRDVALPHRWEGDPGRAAYSGGAAYETTFEAEPSWLADAGGGGVRLDFGPSERVPAGSSEEAGIRGSSYRVEVSPPVREVAVVSLNGRPCGVLWAPPYVVDLTAALREGENRLRVVVYNTAANALSADTHIHALAEQSASRYGRRFRMQDLDLALDGVSSGLHRVPELVRGTSQGQLP